MRVDNIGTPRNIPDSPQRPGLAEGDVLIAEVTDIKGDKVFLKNQDGGAVLTAKLLGDIGVAVGDYVETVVDEASGGRYVLRVVDISRQAPFATGPEMAADMQALSQAAKTQALLSTLNMLRNNPGADPKAAAFLSRHGIAGTAENIDVLSQMAKGPSPVTALLTQIIESLGASPKIFAQSGQPLPLNGEASQNAQPQTAAVLNGGADAVPAETAPPEGSTPVKEGAVRQTPGQSQELSGVLQNRIQSDAAPGRATSAEPGQTNQMQAGPVSGSAAQNTSQQILSDQTKLPDTNTQTAAQPMPAGVMPSAPAAQSQHPVQTQAGLTVIPEPDAPIPQSAAQTALPAELVPAAPNGQPQPFAQPPAVPNVPVDAQAGVWPQASETAAAPQPKPSVGSSSSEGKPVFVPNAETAENTGSVSHKGAEIVQKALDMFVPMDDAEKLAVHLKKAVHEMPEQLKELKLLADHADNTVREAVASKLDQAEKQMSLMSEVKRFDCYQIPLQTGTQRQTTAELFVYRYRGGKKSVDPDNILILLGLDTQYMGRVETLVKTSGKNLNIEFNMENMRLADEMLSDATQLKSVVQQTGYTLAGISVKQLSARTTVLNAEERFEKEADGSAGNVDIRI